MDLHSLHLDRCQKRAAVCAADAAGVTTAELMDAAYERVLAAAQPLFQWAHGRVPQSARTPCDSTLVAFEVDALARTLRLAYVAERTRRGETPSSPSNMSPALSWCDSSYEAHQTLLREAARTAVRELRPRTPDPEGLTPESRWEYCYKNGGDGWELGRPPPPLVRSLSRPAQPLAAGERALVIGCGRGHESLILARAAQAVGAQVAAIDIAPTAVRLANQAAADAGLAACLRTYECDLFTTAELPFMQPGTYDLLLEHTCFCAIPPARRDEYMPTVARLLKPGGRFIGLFYCHDYPGGPPYASSVDELRERLLPAFMIEHEEVPRDSILTRAGLEWLLRARRRA